MRSADRGGRVTLRALLRDAVRRLTAAHLSYGHGTTNARDEAAWLVTHALGLDFEALDANLDRVLSAVEARRAQALVERRIRSRKPAAYLTRKAWLGEHAFYVDERVIVPRSYIAELLRDDLSPWVARPDRVRSALDLCTGSGCLAILLALSFTRAEVDAVDISRDALAVAKRNVSAYRLQRRVRLLCSDVYSNAKLRRYDVIAANPPYVSERAMRALPAEYRKEPALALAGGRDGLDIVRRIVRDAEQHLQPGGLLVVEVGHHRARVERALPRLPLVWPQTSAGDDCVFVITREALRDPSRARSGQASAADASRRRRGAVRADRV